MYLKALIFGVCFGVTFVWNNFFGFYETASVSAVILNQISFLHLFATVVQLFELSHDIFVVVNNSPTIFSGFMSVEYSEWFRLTYLLHMECVNSVFCPMHPLSLALVYLKSSVVFVSLRRIG
jgi:hypothetical protein